MEFIDECLVVGLSVNLKLNRIIVYTNTRLYIISYTQFGAELPYAKGPLYFGHRLLWTIGLVLFRSEPIEVNPSNMDISAIRPERLGRQMTATESSYCISHQHCFCRLMKCVTANTFCLFITIHCYFEDASMYLLIHQVIGYVSFLRLPFVYLRTITSVDNFRPTKRGQFFKISTKADRITTNYWPNSLGMAKVGEYLTKI